MDDGGDAAGVVRPEGGGEVADDAGAGRLAGVERDVHGGAHPEGRVVGDMSCIISISRYTCIMYCLYLLKGASSGVCCVLYLRHVACL